jgi:hypothetical protein
VASDERRSPPVTPDDSAFEAPAEQEMVLELSRPAPRAPAPPAQTDLPPATAPPASDPPVQAARCRRHPERVAGWWCLTCGALCPTCMAMQRLSTRRAMAVCGSCGRAVQTITIPRSAVTSFALLSRLAFWWPLRPAGVVFIATISLLGLAPVVDWIAYAAAWGYLFAIVRSAGQGTSRLVLPESLSDGPEDILMPAIRGVAATGWLWIPSAFYLERHYQFLSGGAAIPEIARDPAVWLLPVLGLPSLPIAAMAAATDIALVDLFNPLFLGRAIAGIGRDYWFCVAVLAAAWVLVGCISLVTVKFGGTVGLLVRNALLSYGCLFSARAVGGLLYLHGHAVGWGDEADYRVPVLPGAP